jgi:hypothetical protein
MAKRNLNAVPGSWVIHPTAASWSDIVSFCPASNKEIYANFAQTF